MNKKNLLVKIVLAAFVILLLISLIAPAVFPQRADIRQPRQETLLNGLKVIMFSDPRSDRVSLKLRINSGSAFDPQGKEGVMKLLSDNIFPNDEARNLFAEELGGSLAIDTNYDYIQINATARPDQFLTMLDTVANAVSSIDVNKETTARLKAAQLTRVQELEKNPAYVADQSVAKRLFGMFPYGRPVDGTSASIDKIGYADLVDAKLRFFTSDNATLAISGNFDSNLAYRAARRLFGGWIKADKKSPSTFRQPDAPDPTLQSVVLDGGGDKELRYAVRGVARNDANYASSEVLAEIMRARLGVKNEGANVNVESDAHVLPGNFVIRISGRSVTTITNDPAQAVAQVLTGKITDAEFQAAKSVVDARRHDTDPMDLWLDVDTFKTGEPKNAGIVITLSDVQNLADKVSKLPVASVIVERLAETNSVPK
ncbi:MAG TPA: insulinase family protein [Pyrinomonadaceae bacterium]|nr:insulinase family protein [Pyrinomonadaceae bacterium]